MNKTKSLVLQCIGVFVAFLGVWWWVGREYKKTHPEPIRVGDYVIYSEEYMRKYTDVRTNEPRKVVAFETTEHDTYAIFPGSKVMSIRWLKKTHPAQEMAFPSSKTYYFGEAKVYRGKWHKDYLEVIK